MGYEYERDAWWRVVVDSKFGSLWGGWCFNESRGVYGVGYGRILGGVERSF
jgi:hypothetical protein